MKLETENIIAVGGGGSGPISIEDKLLDRTPDVYSIVGVHDAGGKRGKKGGGHSSEIRTLLGTLPPGDATHRIAVHIRNPYIRELLTYRWHLEKRNKLNGNRPANELLAAAEYITGRHSLGIKRLEEAFRADYKGRVIPVSDDNFHLRAKLSDGSYINGEGAIDTRRRPNPRIVDFDFIPHPICPNNQPITPEPNQEALETIEEAAIFADPPGSEYGSRKPVLRILNPALKNRQFGENPLPIVWFCNAFTNISETHGWAASQFAESEMSELGFRPHIALINVPNHEIPPTYAKKEKSYVVIPDIDACRPFVEEVYGLPLTELFYSNGSSNGKWIVRHNGELCAEIILGVMAGKSVKNILEELNTPYVH